MEIYQQGQLEGKLEELLLTGMTQISWDQIYVWYRVAKINKMPWRDIKSRWEMLCELQGIDDAPAVSARTGSGGVRLLRPYLERFDGSEIDLVDLAG